MTEILVMAGIAGAALFAWHLIHARRMQQAAVNGLITQAAQVTYFGAPAWPAMGPRVVPQLALPTDVRALPTYYGVSADLLDQDIANA